MLFSAPSTPRPRPPKQVRGHAVLCPRLGGTLMALLVATGLFFTLARSAHAADIAVDGTTCTLSDAITAANTDIATGGCPAGNGTDTLTIQQDITLDAALPDLSSAMTIQGDVATRFVSGNNALRIFNIASGATVTIDTLTLKAGKVTGNGGGISNNGTLTVTNTTATGNTATGNGGAIFNGSGAILTVNNSSFLTNTTTTAINSSTGGGGAIYNNAGMVIVDQSTFVGNSTGSRGGAIFSLSISLVVNNSTFTKNLAASRGGALYNFTNSVMNVNDSTFVSNKSSTSTGGAIYSQGTLTVNSSTLSGNTATNSGGAIFSTARLTVTNSALSSNSTTSSGGAIYNQQGILAVTSSILSNNIANNSGGAIAGNGTLRVISSTLSGNTANQNSGAIDNSATLTLSNSTISGNWAALRGGGIFNWNTMTVSNSIISDNTANLYGGGIQNQGPMTVLDSTISDNTAIVGGGGIVSLVSAAVSNSTISGNIANQSAGGIFNGSTMTMTNSTLSANSAGNNGGAILNFGTLTLQRALIAGNTASTGPEILNEGGTVNANNYNLIGYGGSAHSDGFTPGSSDIVPSDPLETILNLTLADNGGPAAGSGPATWTHALVDCSAAIDAAGSSGLATDQRGVARPQNIADDIGAFELVMNGPTICVRGNDLLVTNGAHSASTANGTSFGNVAPGSTVAHTFIIHNTGNADLSLNGTTPVALSGSPLFSVTAQPTTTLIAPGDSASFVVTVAPTAFGIYTTTVTIVNNDMGGSPYTFVLQGYTLPVVEVRGKGQSIANGDNSPSSGDGTDFGMVPLQARRQQAFTLGNTGVTGLTVNSVTFGGAHADDFSLVASPAFPLTLAPGAVQTITVQVQPRASDLRTANLVVDSNDLLQPNYSFALQSTDTRCTIYSATDLALAIPDLTIIYADLIVPDSLLLTDVNVRNLQLLHTWDSDLKIDLLSPNGTAVTLVSGRGDDGDNFTGTNFDDAATTAISNGTAPFAGTFQPEQALSAFNGSNSQGQWRLRFYDSFSGDAGTLQAWTLELCGTAPPAQLQVQGKGQIIANGDNSPNTVDGTDFGMVTGQDGQQQAFVLQNTGGADLTINSINLSGDQAGNFSLVNLPSLPLTLASGVAQTITVAFSPTSLGNMTATLNIASNDNTANPYTFVVGGVSAQAAPEIDLQGNGVSITNGDSSPSSTDGTDFGGLVMGSTLVRTFTIRNSGLLDLTALAVRVSGDAAFQLSSPPAATVSPDGSTTFAVTFAPTRLGRVVATVNIANNDEDESPYTFVLSGAGATPEIDLQGNGVSIVSGDTTPSLNDQTQFGTVATGSTLVRDFIIRNSGQANLTGIAATISGAGAFSISTLPAATVSAGGNTTLRVTFAPTSGGAALATVSIANSDSDENPYTFVVGGTGAVPVLEVQGNSQRITPGDSSPSLADGTDFGGVAQQSSQRKSFTLRNLGAAPLAVNSVTFGGAHQADFSLVTPPAFPLTLAPGAAQTLTVQLQPSAAGVRTANLVVNSNDPTTSAYSFALQNREALCTVYPGGNTPLAIPDQQAVAAAVVVPTNGQVLDVNVRNVQIQHTYDGDLQFGLISPAGALVVLADNRGGGGRHYTNTTFDDAAGTPIAAGSAPFSDIYRPENPLSVLNGRNSQGQWRLVFYDTAVGDTGTLTGWSLELCTLLAPNLSVRGNGYAIVHGDSTPSGFDQTFVGATTAGAPLVRTFAISNTGAANLTAVAVSISGNAAFSINAQPAATVNAGGNSSFQLTFTPSSLGVVTATVQVASNDPNANPYTFVVQGAGLEAPPVFLTGWGTEGAGDWMFNNPFGVAVDRSGNIYVADTFNHRLQRFDRQGNQFPAWGAQGSGAGQFLAPFGVAVDSSGNVYVGDTLNQRIQKFTSSGTFLTQWGVKGSGAGQFNNPKGVAVDSSGNVYVADSLNQRIQKFTSNGAFLTQWGLQGSGPGQFDGPANVAVDSRDPNQIYVYVADGNNHRIQKFTSNGVFVTQWGSYGGGAGQLYSPYGLAVDGTGNVYVADSMNDRIQKFSSSGSLLAQWGGTGGGAGRFFIPGTIAINRDGHVIVADTFNHRLQIFGPAGPVMAVTSAKGSIPNGDTTASTNDGTDFGRAIATKVITGVFTLKNVGLAPLTGIVVTVNGNSAFSVGKPPLTTLGVGGNSNFSIRFAPSSPEIVTATVSIASNGTPYTFVVQGMGLEAPPAFVSDFGVKDGCFGLFASPAVSAQDSQGNIFITDIFRHCMYKFKRNGTFLTQWGTKGSANSQFNMPLGVAVDRAGNVYVVDTFNHRIQKFDNHGNFLTKWGSKGSGLRQFDTPIAITVDRRSDPTADYLWIVDGEIDRVLKYDTNGNFIANLGTFASLGQRLARRGGTALAEPASNIITFNNPTGVATDSSGNLYVIDNDNSRLQKFASNGAFLTTWATGVGSSGQANQAVALAVDSRDPNNVKVYMADPVNNRIRQFDGNGAFLSEWGSVGSGPGEFNNPTGLLVDENGYLYVVDSGNQRIQIFGYPQSAPVMAVQGNGIRIASGDSTPSLSDQTDLGGVITGNSLVRAFTITNSGGADLTGVAVNLSGNAAVSVSSQPAATISAGSSSTFQLTLAPTSSGQVTATVNISSNDSLANPYTFVVQGQALDTATPQSVIAGNGRTIANGDTTPSHSDHTVIGGITVGGVVSRTFTIYNRGTADLTGLTASVSGDGAVQIASQPAATLSPGGSSTFVVTFAPSSVGAVAATVSMASNDSAANPYTFVVQGTGLATPLPFRRQWGTLGNAAGQFAGPYGVATDSLGNLYVVDGNNHRVQQFDHDGNYVAQWNTSASSNGQAASPYAIAVDSRDSSAIIIYVVDTNNHLVKKFDSTGALLTFWGGYGSAAGQFNKPAGVAVDGSGNVYVTDSFNQRIQKFDSTGTFLARWGALGSADGEFMLPAGIAVDSSNNVYVADSLNQRVQKFTSSGAFLAQWGSYGNGVGQFNRPVGVAVDGSGNLYVTDSGNHRILKFTATGSLLTQWGGYGSAAGAFALPAGVATDSDGNLYVADTGNHRIQQFGLVAEIAVTGNSIALANNDTTPTVADNTDFGSVTTGSAPVVHTFTIGNNGARILELYNAAQVDMNEGISVTLPTAIIVTVSDSAAFTVTTQPADTVAPNGTTNFALRFAPTAAGSYTTTVYLASNDHDDPLFSFVVQGTASPTAAPQLRLNGQQAPNGGLFADTSNGTDFGVMLTGSTVTRTYTLSNTGNADLTVNAITLSGGTANAFAVSGVTLPLTIGAGSSSSFSVRLAPSAVGVYTTTVNIDSNDPSQNSLAFTVQGTAKELFAPEINMAGQGVSIPNGDTTPNATDGTSFGNVTTGSTVTQTYMLSNTGNADLAVSAITLNGGQSAAFALGGVSIPFTVTAGSSATFTVSLTPSAVGLFTTTVSIANNDGDETPYTFVIGGQGVLPSTPELAIQGQGVHISNGDTTPDTSDDTDFGTVTVGSAVTHTFTISNPGSAALTVSAITLGGGQAGNFTVSGLTLPATVAAGSSSTFALRLAPTVSGTLTTTVSIASNDSANNPYTFVVQGIANGQINTGSNISQQSVTTLYNATPQSCATVAAPGLPIHTLTPTLRNDTATSYRGLSFVVTELRYTAVPTYTPTLCNADGGQGGAVGATLTLADATLGSDGSFAPAESFAQALQVGLPVRARYRLFVNLYGRPATVTAADSQSPTAGDLLGTLGWEIDEDGNVVDTSMRLFLPLVAK